MVAQSDRHQNSFGDSLCVSVKLAISSEEPGNDINFPKIIIFGGSYEVQRRRKSDVVNSSSFLPSAPFAPLRSLRENLPKNRAAGAGE